MSALASYGHAYCIGLAVECQVRTNAPQQSTRRIAELETLAAEMGATGYGSMTPSNTPWRSAPGRQRGPWG
jgi:hypothetical protein